MTFESSAIVTPNYAPCRYGKSKLLFRGPRQSLEQPFIAALGGSETYGEWVHNPWPELLSDALNMPVVNFGCLNAGLDVFLHEPHLQDVLAKAQMCVVQLLGPETMSNRFYAVHPRRNNRFLRASKLMRSVFQGVDFDQFNFIPHMLDTLEREAPDGFESLARELQVAWVARMTRLLNELPGQKVLLAIEAAPLAGARTRLLTADMIAQVARYSDDVVHVACPAIPEKALSRAEEMFLAHTQVQNLPDPRLHVDISRMLAPAVSAVLKPAAQ